jgi:hypothetical protein
MILLLLTAIGVAAVDHSGQESAGRGRTRAAMQVLYAADAGIEFARSRIAQNDPSAIDFTLPGGITVQSRRRSVTGAQVLPPATATVGGVGYSLLVGTSGGGQVFLVNITATGPNSAAAEIEAKIARGAPVTGQGGYR